MLSQDIENLQRRIEVYRREGVFLEPAGIASICAILQTAAADARALEQSAIKQCCIKVLPSRKYDDEDVVDLNEARAKRDDVENWIRGQGVTVLHTPGPDGDDAA